MSAAGPAAAAPGRGMDVLLINQFFPPETGAGANRAGAIAAALRERCRLRVATLAPGYPDPALYPPGAAERWDAACGFPVVRRPPFRPHDASLPRRALREIGMSLALVRAARGERPDLVLVSTPSMFLAPAAWVAARLAGARFAWDVRDLTWRYARENAPTGRAGRWALAAIERLMLGLLRRTDLVIAATDGLGEVLREQGIPAGRMVTVRNGIPRSFLDAFPADAPPPGNPRPRVTYTGLMGYNHGIGILLDVALRLPEVDFVLIGDGPERPAISARHQRERPGNVTLHGFVTDPDALVAHLAASDVLVNHTRGTPTLNRIVYPAKTFEYFATRRPVVYAGAGWAAERFRERDLAVVVPPDDPDALAAGIRAVLCDPAGARARSERARRSVEQEFSRERLMTALADEIERRFGGRR